MFVLSVHPQHNQTEGSVITDSDNMWKPKEHSVISQNQLGGTTTGHHLLIEEPAMQVLANASKNNTKGKLWRLTSLHYKQANFQNGC